MKYQAVEFGKSQQRISATSKICYFFVFLIGEIVNVIPFEFLEAKSCKLEVKRNVLCLHHSLVTLGSIF